MFGFVNYFLLSVITIPYLVSVKTPSRASLPSFSVFALDDWRKVPDMQSRISDDALKLTASDFCKNIVSHLFFFRNKTFRYQFSPRHSQKAPTALPAALQLFLLIYRRSLRLSSVCQIHASMISQTDNGLAELIY